MNLSDIQHAKMLNGFKNFWFKSYDYEENYVHDNDPTTTIMYHPLQRYRIMRIASS